MDMPKLGLAVICLLLLSEFLMFQVLREIRWLEIEESSIQVSAMIAVLVAGVLA